MDKDHLILAIYLARAFPELTPRKIAVGVESLRDIGRELHLLYEHACNRELRAAEQTRMKKLEAQAKLLAGEIGAKDVILNSDPRGAALKLVLPGGQMNDFGGEGWIV